MEGGPEFGRTTARPPQECPQKNRSLRGRPGGGTLSGRRVIRREGRKKALGTGRTSDGKGAENGRKTNEQRPGGGRLETTALPRETSRREIRDQKSEIKNQRSKIRDQKSALKKTLSRNRRTGRREKTPPHGGERHPKEGPRPRKSQKKSRKRKKVSKEKSLKNCLQIEAARAGRRRLQRSHRRDKAADSQEAAIRNQPKASAGPSAAARDRRGRARGQNDNRRPAGGRGRRNAGPRSKTRPGLAGRGFRRTGGRLTWSPRA
jgi:hypothetical protein